MRIYLFIYEEGLPIIYEEMCEYLFIFNFNVVIYLYEEGFLILYMRECANILSYMRKGFLIYEGMSKYLVIHEEGFPNI
jgi:hypothetical protein